MKAKAKQTVQVKVKKAKPKAKRPKITAEVFSIMFQQKEFRKKNASNYNDPKTMSTYNQKDWPTGQPNGNYKLDVDVLLFSEDYGKSNFKLVKGNTDE